MVVASLALNLTGTDCPLTGIEKHLRRRGGESGYRGGFVAHYVVTPLHQRGITTEVRVLVYVVAVAPTTIAYAAILTRRRRSRLGPARPRTALG